MIHTEPEMIEILPAMKERLDRFRGEHKNDPFGDVGSRVIFEDEFVKIWEMKLEPGESSALHRHDNDYYLAMFQGDFVAGVTPEGSDVETFVCRIPKDGNTVSIPKGGTEWAYNVGNETFREIMVELKKP